MLLLKHVCWILWCLSNKSSCIYTWQEQHHSCSPVFLFFFQGYHFRSNRINPSHFQPGVPVDLSFIHCTHCALNDSRWTHSKHLQDLKPTETVQVQFLSVSDGPLSVVYHFLVHMCLLHSGWRTLLRNLHSTVPEVILLPRHQQVV